MQRFAPGLWVPRGQPALRRVVAWLACSAARRRRRLLAALSLALLTAVAVSDAHAKAEPLDPDEDVLFLPSTARQLEDGRIEVDLQAWIHEKDRRKILDTALAGYLGLKLSTMSPAARFRFAQRTSLFHA